MAALQEKIESNCDAIAVQVTEKEQYTGLLLLYPEWNT